MIHLTLSTGNSRHSPRDEVGRHSLALVADGLIELLAREHHVERWPLPRGLGHLSATSQGSSLVVTAWQHVAAVNAEMPLATWGVAPDAAVADALWPVLVRQQDLADDLLRQLGIPSHKREVQRPATTPWTGVVLEAALGFAPDAASWIGDLERVVAWAWIDFQRNSA